MVAFDEYSWRVYIIAGVFFLEGVYVKECMRNFQLFLKLFPVAFFENTAVGHGA